MTTTKIKKIRIAGIKVNTTNENMKSIEDQGRLWERFIQEKIVEKLGEAVINPFKIYGVYFNYSGDYTQPYSFIAGVEVDESKLPQGYESVEVTEGEYTEFPTIDGDLQTRIGEVWGRIWNSGLKRSYSCDFELYDYSNGENPEIRVFIS